MLCYYNVLTNMPEHSIIVSLMELSSAKWHLQRMDRITEGQNLQMSQDAHCVKETTGHTEWLKFFILFLFLENSTKFFN